MLLLALALSCGEMEEIDSSEDALGREGATTIVQVNPFYGGRHDGLDHRSPKTYRTARRFARRLDERYRRTSVIGMQEITSTANADRIRSILEEETGHPWEVRHFHQSTAPDALPSSQEAIFWRSDVHEVIEDFGTREVEQFDHRGGKQSLRFGGLLLRRIGTGRELAMFTGKLVPLGKRRDGRLLTNFHRAREAARLMRWIDSKLEQHPTATRVIAVDANADFGSAPWQRFRTEYWDGDDDRATHFTFGARRIDFLFWDHDAGPRRTDGFLLGPLVSPDFGSDHRAVIARVHVGG